MFRLASLAALTGARKTRQTRDSGTQICERERERERQERERDRRERERIMKRGLRQSDMQRMTLICSTTELQ